TSEIIRQQFNDGQYYQRASRGELQIKLRKSKHPDDPPEGEPICTFSQIVVYYDQDGQPVALAHQ
ncbi:MAG: hypothetical protein ACE5FI_00485, partial [Anaerolineales bacterium]